MFDLKTGLRELLCGMSRWSIFMKTYSTCKTDFQCYNVLLKAGHAKVENYKYNKDLDYGCPYEYSFLFTELLNEKNKPRKDCLNCLNPKEDGQIIGMAKR